VTARVGTAEVERFRGIVAQRIRLRFDADRVPLLAGVLNRRAEAYGEPAHRYLDRIGAAATAA
jgi:hypothetical protein